MLFSTDELPEVAVPRGHQIAVDKRASNDRPIVDNEPIFTIIAFTSNRGAPTVDGKFSAINETGTICR